MGYAAKHITSEKYYIGNTFKKLFKILQQQWKLLNF